MLEVQGKAKPDIENIRGLNLEMDKLTTFQVSKLPLYHKIREIGMICSAKPILTEDLCVMQEEKFAVIFYVRFLHLTKAKHIHKRHTDLSPERMLHKDYDRKRSFEKNLCSWVSRGLAPSELIGGKPPVIK
jgi:hypothetical protein